MSRKNSIAGLTELEKAKFLDIFILTSSGLNRLNFHDRSSEGVSDQ